MRKARLYDSWWVLLVCLLVAGGGCKSIQSGRDAEPDLSATGQVNMAGGQSPAMRIPLPGGALPARVPGDASRDPIGSGDVVNVDQTTPGVGAPSSGLGYRLQCGDSIVVSLRAISTPDNIEDVVDADGFINMPYLGNIHVAGRTTSEIEKLLHARYVPDYYRQATLTVLVPTQRSYYIKGEVRAPGRFPFIAGVTLLRAVSGAGGPNDYANPKKITVIRGNERMGPFNMFDIQDDPSSDVIIEPGDVIDVPRGIFG